MAGKATAKPKVKNGVDKEASAISMTYIDDLILRMDKAEDHIDSALSGLDSLDLRTKKVEARLGIG